MLMERRASTHVPQDDWYAWLHQAVREDRPWNEMVHEILTADGDDPATRPAARFFLDRQSEPHLLTRDIGRIFFGRDLKCAQCHDHPLIDDYLQADYHGLHAFLVPGYAVVRKIKTKDGDKETTTDQTVHAETAGADLAFSSVFIKDTHHRTGPRLFNDVTIEEPFFYPGDEYKIPPSEGVTSVPQFSRRARLAEQATNGRQRMFNDNIANRLWAHMLGRGLVHPVDLQHSDNPATHPDLLRLLGERFSAMGFNIRGFFREIALTQVYQRSFDRPDDLLSLSARGRSRVSELEASRPEVAEAASESAGAFTLAGETREQAESKLMPAAKALGKARQSYSEAMTTIEAAVQALETMRADHAQKQTALQALQHSAAAAGSAVVQLPNDRELALVTETLAQKIAALSTAVTELTKSIPEQESVAVAAREALQAVRESLEVTSFHSDDSCGRRKNECWSYVAGCSRTRRLLHRWIDAFPQLGPLPR